MPLLRSSPASWSVGVVSNWRNLSVTLSHQVTGACLPLRLGTEGITHNPKFPNSPAKRDHHSGLVVFSPGFVGLRTPQVGLW